MKKDKMSRIEKKKIIKRAVSTFIAFVMLLNEIYVYNILDRDIFNKKSSVIMASAADEDPEFKNYTPGTNEIKIDIEDFVDYSEDCQKNPISHQEDKIIIKFRDVSKCICTGFAGIGTASYPFKGSIEILSGNDITLNLDAPLFNYVYDNVKLNNDSSLKISRYYYPDLGTDETTPIIAQNVVNGEGSASWNIDLVPPIDTDNTYHLGNYGGFIGNMQAGTEVSLSVTMNTSEEDENSVAITGSGDLGLACGHMGANSSLTFSLEHNRTISGISTDSGDVGGLVGEMETGADFTYNVTNDTDFLASGTVISTSNGYAGGIVGNYAGNSVTLGLPDGTTQYPIDQSPKCTSGVGGAGGIYGCFKPAAALTDSNAFDVSKYDIDCCVNGIGYTGGLFGVLETSFDVTIENGTVTVDHYSEGCTAYGGLIGKYKADNTALTLKIDGVTVSPTKTGSAAYYGGGIGEIATDTPAYVEFSSFTVDDASDVDDKIFGGLVASADNAYIKVSGVSVDANGYMGGGLVGSLKNGVLQISGSNSILGASAGPGEGDELKVGQYVGYRDNGLVFMDVGASCSLGHTSDVDDIGSWGGIIKLDAFGTNAGNVLIASNHAVTVGTQAYGFTSIGDKEQFAVTALRFQIDGNESETGNPFVTFANNTLNSGTIANTDISITSDVVLTGTGIYGLTRDNDISSDNTMNKCVYSGIFGNSSASKTITFDTATIYRHKYNGLFANLNNGTVKYVTFAGRITVKAKEKMFVGAAAAIAQGSFTTDHVTVSTAMSYAGGSELYLGGILGVANSSIGTINVSDCTVNANITGNNNSACVGGVIGQISHNSDNSKTWNFENVSLNGNIKNEASMTDAKIGGLIAVVLGSYSGNNSNTIRKLTLNGINASGLTVWGNGSTSMGGLLGYSWLKTDVDLKSVTISSSTVKNSGSGSVAGIVYRATGKWNVESLTEGLTIDAASATSVGMIVNKGISADSKSAIYLRLPSGYTYDLTNADVSTVNAGVFDELCAYTASDSNKILKNGNGIISINSPSFRTDDTLQSGSYHAQTAKGAVNNPYSRYYYNLDTFDNDPEAATRDTSSSAKLLCWGVNQYACDNIKRCFSDLFNAVITQASYDMENYSWYPIDLDKNITLNGTFKFYSHEFELSETEKYNAETTNNTALAFNRTNLGNNQHYTMHCGLFRNVKEGVTLTIGNTTFQGNVGRLGDNSGALIWGTVQGQLNTSKATVKVANGGSITLDGIYVYGVTVGDSPNYSPLLINKAGNYVNLEINGVSSTGKYKTASEVPYITKDSIYPKAASSLIGSVGLSDAPTGITVDFSDIKLDGRTAALNENGTAYNAELNSIYGTDRSVFTKATLLDSFRYASGSTGKYNFKWSEDWKTTGIGEPVSYTHAGLGVTYGKELGYDQTNYPKTGAVYPYYNSQYPGEEFRYSGESSTSRNVNPVNANDTAASPAYSSGFISDFLPYVYARYDASNNYGQLMVNHAAASATGCGTYDDPYLLKDREGEPGTSGAKDGSLEDFSRWINGIFRDDDKIRVPVTGLTNAAVSGTWCGENDVELTYNNGSFTGTKDGTNYTLAPEKMRTYLAGAYYKIAEGVSSITISNENTFTGLGNTDDKYAVFRGVIDGNGMTIINKTKYPLIESSYGSVIKNVTIQATGGTGITLTGTQDEFDTINGGENNNAAYGAVIAKIFGGDNIIDDVSVMFGTESQKAQITISGSYAQLVPVGGYVGVVLNGGLYFRNMKRVNESGQPALYDESRFDNINFSAVANNQTDSEPYRQNNKEWLYVNPIVGRVINGFAVTESYEITKTENNEVTTVQNKAYRPYENGLRTYNGGNDPETYSWNETNQTENTDKLETIPDDLTAFSHVTMQNGNKNYSIVDLDDSLPMLDTHKDTDTVEVPNGQALFVMSAIVNSGMSNKSLGYNNGYAVSRWAKYDDIGSDAAATGGDYDTAKDDTLANSTSGDKRLGYLMHEYTSGATAISGANKKIDLSGDKYYLPDGFKGIGNMYHDYDIYRMKITDFDGNGAEISMNSSWYYYMKDTNGAGALKLFDIIYHHHDHVGFGLFNYMNGATNGGSDGSTNKYYNFILKGNVVTDCINSSSTAGEHIYYKGARSESGYDQPHYSTTNGVTKENAVSVDGDYMVSAGGLIGVTNASQWLDRVALQNMYVHGIRYSGGLIGLNIGDENTSFTYRNTEINDETLGSSMIKVRGASTCGGMIGKNQFAQIDIDNGNASYSITEVVSECQNMDGSDYNYGVGGFIGACRTGPRSGATTNKITIKNIIVGTDNQPKPSSVMVKNGNVNIFAGGMIGILNKGTLTITDCQIYNQSVSTPYIAGGLCGYYATATGEGNISDVIIYAKDYHSSDSSITNPQICSTNKAAGGFFGSLKDEFNVGGKPGNTLNIFNSQINGYTISVSSDIDCYAGGAVGLFGHEGGGTNTDNIWNLYNVAIENCTISASSTGNGKAGYAGGIVGGIAERGDATHGKYLNGYNILTKNLKFTGDNPGSIYGKMLNSNYCSIKLAGFSRQGTMIAALAGVTVDNDHPYGNDGYVIFADYDDKASSEKNAERSNMLTGVDNVGTVPIGSRQVTREYTIIAKRGENGSVNVVRSDYNETDTPLSGIISGLGEGERQIVSSSGTRWRYAKDNSSTAVTSIDDLTSTRASGGFNLYLNNGKYITNGLNGNNALIEADAAEQASIWYFESDTNGFKLYTMINNQKRYIHNKSGNLLELSENAADVFELEVTGSSFYIKKYNESKWLQHSGSGTGIRYWTDTNNAGNSKINIKYAIADEALQKWVYSNLLVSGITGSVAGAHTDNNATDDEKTAYEATLSNKVDNYVNTDQTYEVYEITEVAKENVYIDGLNSKPFVTTNPKGLIAVTNEQKMQDGEPVVDDQGNPVYIEQFLTGDGVSSNQYISSAFRHIIAAQTEGSPKAYTTCDQLGDITDDDMIERLAKLRSVIKNSYTEYMTYVDTEDPERHIKNFPLLVAEETDRTKLTQLINDYLCTLTNTKYNFADKSDQMKNVFEVGLYKCTYDNINKKFAVDTNEHCLKMGSENKQNGGVEYYFYMDAKDVDTKDVPQFTLMDVQFKDPGHPNKIAYHLYVPVYVKKVLRFNFNAQIKSGSDYYWDAYDKVNDNETQALFENLGNTVTIAFEWEYDRKGTDWADAINGGDCLLTNYYKSFKLINHVDDGNDWAAGTRMVLVDASNNGKLYYLDDPPNIPNGSVTFSLFDFKDEAGNRYRPVDLQDLMTIEVAQDNAGMLTTEGATEDNASIKVNNQFYRPILLAELEDANNPFPTDKRYKVTNVTNIKTERYYLSIFTKADNDENSSDYNKLYHYEMYSPDSFASTGYASNSNDTWNLGQKWRSNKIDKNTPMNLFTGRLYENDLDLKVVSPKQNLKMSSDNDQLNVTMTANIRLTDTAKNNAVHQNMDSFKEKSSIYQTFLMLYDKRETNNGASEFGIAYDAGDPLGVRADYYLQGSKSEAQLNGLDLSATDGAVTIDESTVEYKWLDKYLEFRNNLNLISFLADSQKGNAVTVQVQFELVYDPSRLVYQFPKKSVSSDENVGASVIGYSKIASTEESAAYSATSNKKTDNNRYYTEGVTTASLTYNVVEAPKNDPAGPYSGLGINAVEIKADEVPEIDTLAVYDISKISNPDDFIELTFTLSGKSDYSDPLEIAEYLPEVMIYGQDRNNDEDDDVIFSSTEGSESEELRKTTVGEKIYKVRVRKDLLRTQSNGSFVIPIKFKVNTGNDIFKNDGLQYSNYKVTISAAIYSAIDGDNFTAASADNDYIIYTNAIVLTSVVD